jgi:Tfp pilus assembly PilM family ATPase
MFNFFSKTSHVVGLDIKAGHIRFVELVRSAAEDHIHSYGEVVPEEVVIENGVIVNEARLVTYLRDIKKNLKSHHAVVSLPDGANSRIYRDVLRKAGIKARDFVSVSVALEQSLVPKGSETSFIVVDAEADAVNFLAYAPLEKTLSYVGDPANHSVISNLNRIYIDWYDIHKEKIHYILFSGSRVKNPEFLDYVSRETKLELKRGNVLVNLALDQQKIPIITKEDSYKYAVAIGLSLS